MNINREILTSKLTALPALMACGALVVYVAALSVDAHSTAGPVPTTSTTSVSSTLAPPVTVAIAHIASKPVEKTVNTQVTVTTPKESPAQRSQAVETAQTTDTTTPGMPPEPVELQRNIPPAAAEANPDAHEHLPHGEDYDLPTEEPPGL